MYKEAKMENENNSPTSKKRIHSWAKGLPIGIAIGVALGVGVHNMGIGIPIGVAIGVGLSSALSIKNNKA
jgi:hypothetical protein